jgi:hypothetical protein
MSLKAHGFLVHRTGKRSIAEPHWVPSYRYTILHDSLPQMVVATVEARLNAAVAGERHFMADSYWIRIRGAFRSGKRSIVYAVSRASLALDAIYT